MPTRTAAAPTATQNQVRCVIGFLWPSSAAGFARRGTFVAAGRGGGGAGGGGAVLGGGGEDGAAPAEGCAVSLGGGWSPRPS